MRCDVAVVGGGLAGRLAARALGDVDVLVIDDGGPCRNVGIAAAGGLDSPHRLALALGEAAAQELWSFSRASVTRLLDLAEELDVPHRCDGSRRVSLGPAERAEWEASATLLEAWFGEPVHEEEPPSPTLSGAWRVPGDGWVDTEALLAALQPPRTLAGRATLQSTDLGVRLSVGDQTVESELVIVANGWQAPSVHPWWTPMVFPVRLQGLTGPADPGDGVPSLARHRFEAWVTTPAGERHFVGCRWAEQPEMEAGVTDATTHSDKVLDRQRAFTEAHLGQAWAGEPWTGIAAYPCDGLPLLGPLPGNPRVLSLLGWGGWGLSWMAEAAHRIAGGVLETGVDPLPSWLRARRMV